MVKGTGIPTNIRSIIIQIIKHNLIMMHISWNGKGSSNVCGINEFSLVSVLFWQVNPISCISKHFFDKH